MGTSVKFTVIIPTRERADTLLYCLRTVVAQDYEDLTILVSDNFSQDNTKQVIESFHDPRIKYINTGKRLSMSHNYEFALSHVKDGWVTIIGDDDGLLPGALTTVAQVIRKTKCQTIKANICFYQWPSTVGKEELLTVSLDKGIERRNARAWLGKLMRGDAYYRDLPVLYTGGFVDSRIINKARSSEGVFYFSMHPDTYSMMALVSVLDDYVMLKEPVAVSGVSFHSTGASYYNALSNQGPVQEFHSEENIPFDNRLISKDFPRSGEILIYEGYLQAAHLHHDFLKVRMEDQLGLALSRSSPDRYDALRKYCVAIADRNGIDMSVVDCKEKAFRKSVRHRWGILRSLKLRIYRNFNYRVLSGKEFGIHDIYGASILARAVFLLETRYARWKVKQFFQGVRRMFWIFFEMEKVNEDFE